MREWIAREAEAATSNEDLARRFVAECRRTRTILPGSSTIERLCADALVEAERRIEDLIAHRITPTLSENLAHLLEDTVDGRVTRFVWLVRVSNGAWQDSQHDPLRRAVAGGVRRPRPGW